MMKPRTRRPWPLVVACLLSACQSEAPSEPRREPPGLAFVAGDHVTDSIEAEPSLALRVRVIGDDGRPLRNAVVRLRAMPLAPSAARPFERPSMSVSTLATNLWSSFVAVTTDTAGIAAVTVKLGTEAGPAGLIATVPEAGFVDTATYTIRAGNAVRLRMSPRDTMVQVGRRLLPRAVVQDRHDNPRTDPVTWSVAGPAAALVGDSVSGTAVGRAGVLARAGTLVDSGSVTVVPTGTLAAYLSIGNSGQQVTLCMFNLDGTGFRRLVPTVVGAGYFGEMPAAWTRDGRAIVYHDNKVDHTKALWSVDVSSGVTRRLVDAGLQLAHEAWPAVSVDGRWVYYNGEAYNGADLYRVRPDGTGRERVGPAGLAQLLPAVSPDGQRVASIAVQGALWRFGGTLQVLDLVSAQRTSLGIQAQAPAWSPDGTLIAFADAGTGGSGALTLVRPDGSGLRRVGTRTNYHGRPAWSPDGRYLVGSSGSDLVLVVVASGEEIPLRYSSAPSDIAFPAWRP